MDIISQLEDDTFADSDDDVEEDTKDSILNARIQESVNKTIISFNKFLNKPEHINGPNNPTTNVVDRYQKNGNFFF